jgi:hypothetical protein
MLPVPWGPVRPSGPVLSGNWLTSPINPCTWWVRRLRVAHGNGLFDAARGGFERLERDYIALRDRSPPDAANDFVSERSGESPKSFTAVGRGADAPALQAASSSRRGPDVLGVSRLHRWATCVSNQRREPQGAMCLAERVVCFPQQALRRLPPPTTKRGRSR